MATIGVRTAVSALVLAMGLSGASALWAEEPLPEKLELKDGATLYLYPDGTSRMVDQHGKRVTMGDGVEMQLADGRTVMMKNKKVWVSVGPPGKGGAMVKKTD